MNDNDKNKLYSLETLVSKIEQLYNLEQKLVLLELKIESLLSLKSDIKDLETNLKKINFDIEDDLKKLSNSVEELDKKIIIIEHNDGIYDERWKNISASIIQLIWIILAAYVLTKLNLQPPAVS